LPKGIGLDAGSIGDVFPVGHHEINGEVGFDPGHTVVDGMASGFSNNVADEQNVHESL
jgi:hypothetical protein